MDTEAGVASVRIHSSLPAVDAPVHQRWSEQHKAQLFIAGHGAGLVVEPPAENLPYGFLHQVALYGLRRLVENPPVAQGTPQLHILGMSPNQWTSRTRGLAAEKLQRWNIVAVPDLLGEQPA